MDNATDLCVIYKKVCRKLFISEVQSKIVTTLKLYTGTISKILDGR